MYVSNDAVEDIDKDKLLLHKASVMKAKLSKKSKTFYEILRKRKYNSKARLNCKRRWST